MDLRFSMNRYWDVAEVGEKDLHPQQVMRRLGITYAVAEPHPIADCWIFRGCQNAPSPLPAYLEVTSYPIAKEVGDLVTAALSPPYEEKRLKERLLRLYEIGKENPAAVRVLRALDEAMRWQNESPVLPS